MGHEDEGMIHRKLPGRPFLCQRGDDESGCEQGNDLQFWPTSRDPGQPVPCLLCQKKDEGTQDLDLNIK